ncbi:tRNA-specific adenosine deaminase 1-like [Mycena indigotica]|uniref:tRNA-specific adenosine deaminase 1-like n=1 Tax=Mycena indigotica TaxID=2126181 RepID=A0A8H6SPH6_9AGAR|nr:tRNA-specific adenosine deaminase 1-like [Mycena indigotica]KAF7301600.1 tRNA-specific adenosine deaminase 1-like [Mycena indigotica]
MSSHNEIIDCILHLYSTLRYKPPPRQWTILAAFYLTSDLGFNIISLATGTKCLAANKLPIEEALHDSHAEILARRGAIRWLFEEIGRMNSVSNFKSEWLQCDHQHSYTMHAGVRIGFYVSTVPCGDCSMGLLSSTQDAEMAALKEKSKNGAAVTPVVSRGRDNYALVGILRTKPARADAPTTASMSCSDKIAAWSFLGIQGALGARFFSAPLYVNEIIVGLDLAAENINEEITKTVRDDCERALLRRMASVSASDLYSFHPPAIHFTRIPFVHSRSMTPEVAASCNDSLFWIADSIKAPQVIINGFKRGVSPNRRLDEKSLPIVCRRAMLKLYNDTLQLCGLTSDAAQPTSLRSIKLTMHEYQQAKDHLMGETGVFNGWIRGSTVSFEKSNDCTGGI